MVLWMGAGGDGEIYARLADLLRAEYGLETLPRMERDERGKPRFPDRPALHFNVSHSGGLLLCGAGGGPLGVDVERVRPRRAGLPAYVLSPAELARFDGGWEEFYRLWTLKESWCKREDAPLFPPRQVETPPPCPHGSWAGGDWRGAVCCSGPPPGEIRWVEAGRLKES